MSQKNDLEQQLICGDPQCPGSSCKVCEAIRISVDEHAMIKCPHGVPSCEDGKWCDKCATKLYPTDNQYQQRGVAVGGRSAPDVVSRQNFKVSSSGPICQGCQKPEGSNPACEECGMLKMTEVHPFTEEDVKELHAKLNYVFSKSSTNCIFELVVPLDILSIVDISWTMDNCAFSTLVLMLSNSSMMVMNDCINQNTFGGYIMIILIKDIRETGCINQILLEVLRLELSKLLRNSSSIDSSKQMDLVDLFNLCVDANIIITGKVQFFPPNDSACRVPKGQDGNPMLVMVKTHISVPSIHELVNGVFSPDGTRRFRLSSVSLYIRNVFSIIIICKGIWRVDGKGERPKQLSLEELLILLANYGGTYFYEEIPSEYLIFHLHGKEDLSQMKVMFCGECWSIYDNGRMVSEITGKTIEINRPFITLSDVGKYLQIFPPLPPPPQASCVSGPSVPPHQPPPHCEQVAQALLPPPLPCAEVGSSPLQQPGHCSHELIKFYRDHFSVVKTDKSNMKPKGEQIQIIIGNSPTFLLLAEHHLTHYVVDGKKYSNEEFFNHVHHRYMQFLREI